MFLQIHTLTSFPASLLNRDDAGLAKRIPFGNALRLRVSSQCLKRHWREDLTTRLPDIPDGMRSRYFFSRVVLPGVRDKGVDEALAKDLVKALAKTVIDGDVKVNGDRSQPDHSQPVLFGRREADYFIEMIVAASQSSDPQKVLNERLKSKNEKDNLKAMGKSAAGLTAALFGRMVTSDMLARVDAPVHVAHAFTVHAANTEMDYFTVVDDLNRDDETGAAHANQTELGAGVYYGYVVVDVPLLVSNLTGCKAEDWRDMDAALPKKVLEALILSVARQSPGAKKGSTAPYAWADLLLLEVGQLQPRTLANAFLDAIPTKGSDPRLVAATRLLDHRDAFDKMYGSSHKHWLATTLPLDGQIDRGAVPDIITWAFDELWS